ncbi:ARM repeat-containing protein [Lentinus tigrinus ALCF2SS1-7]|uniref:ARM repeat-containing protein n=1 Tax=Lentinus tigrinus ALCF2SS1-7 TaxID=1328758 RepID=UPI001165DB4B|nr:ARM repeat-containing protein [Lentinus tigrinus ALCF2SS1-7]
MSDSDYVRACYYYIRHQLSHPAAFTCSLLVLDVPISGAKHEHPTGEDDEVRKTALEFMTTLSESKPGMLRSEPAWVEIVVRGCLEGMGEIPEDDTEAWLEADPAEDPTDDSYPHTYEHSLDRIACALGGQAVLPPAFTFIPAMLASHDWRLRYAGLMAIASIAEGTSKVMQGELTSSYPRSATHIRACGTLRASALDSSAQISSRTGKVPRPIFAALIPALEAPEARVHAHAAAALINFCEGVERDTLIPYLDSIVEQLLKLLNPAATDASKQPKRYVQEQVITTLAMVVDASEATFVKLCSFLRYASIMPLLLNVMQNANGPEYRKLRVKAMECAGLIAIAVGRDVFRPDSRTFVELLMRIENSPADPNDTMLSHFLIATWAKVCQALGEEFEPYLPVVMPRSSASRARKPTSRYETKCQAFEMLLIHASTLNARFGPHVAQAHPRPLPSRTSGTLTQQMVTTTFSQIINCIRTESDASFLASLFKCFLHSMLVIGGPQAFAPELHAGLLEVTKRQLQSLADKRKARAAHLAEDKEEAMLVEEMEDFALEEMAKVLRTLDPNHPLLIAVSSVRELGLHLSEWDGEDEGTAS